MAKEKPLTLSPEDRSRLEAITKAREVIQSGEAKKQLERFIQKSQEA